MSTELNALEQTIRQTANDIVAGLDREQIPLNTALAITGCVAVTLLERASPALRRDFIAALKGEPQ